MRRLDLVWYLRVGMDSEWDKENSDELLLVPEVKEDSVDLIVNCRRLSRLMSAWTCESTCVGDRDFFLYGLRTIMSFLVS